MHDGARISFDCFARLRHEVILRTTHVNWSERDVVLVSELRCQARRDLATVTAKNDWRSRSLYRLGQRWTVRERIVLPGEIEGAADGSRPETGDDLKLLFQPYETFAQTRKRNPVGSVFLFVPSGAESQFDPSTAHGIYLGHRHRERSGKTKRRGSDQRTNSDSAGVAGESRQSDPCVC